MVQAAGIYAVGEVDNGNTAYVAPYQQVLDATLSYPMFYTLQNVFAYQQSMYNIQTQVQAYASAFKDITVLGSFTDNHDNPRYANALPLFVVCRFTHIFFFSFSSFFYYLFYFYFLYLFVCSQLDFSFPSFGVLLVVS